MTRPPAGAALEDHEARLARGLLARVSRSFYVSLRVLPGPVRGPLSAAYLLARAADTIADSAARPAAEREDALAQCRRALADPQQMVPAAAWPLSHAGEEELLRRLPEVFTWFRALPEAEQDLIRGVMAPILDGQCADLRRTAVRDAAELDHYTWQVAGCVGEFWTRLCFLRLEAYASRPCAGMVADGIRLGKGLQLINILRDVPKDRALGRRYLPGTGCEWAAAQPWIAACRGHLEAGARYAAAVLPWRARFACRLPLLIARETLALIEHAGPAAMLAPVKIPRPAVYRLMAAAAFR